MRWEEHGFTPMNNPATKYPFVYFVYFVVSYSSPCALSTLAGSGGAGLGAAGNCSRMISHSRLPSW